MQPTWGSGMASRGRRAGIHCCPLVFLLRLLCRGILGVSRLSFAQPAGGMSGIFRQGSNWLLTKQGKRRRQHAAAEQANSHASKPGC